MSLREVIESQREAITRERSVRSEFKDQESLAILDVACQRIRMDLVDGKNRTCFKSDLRGDTRYYQTLVHFFEESNIPTYRTTDSHGIYSLCVDLKVFFTPK